MLVPARLPAFREIAQKELELTLGNPHRQERAGQGWWRVPCRSAVIHSHESSRCGVRPFVMRRNVSSESRSSR